MSGTHGDLYSEIGELVVAATAGQALDLAATSEELSERYANLNVPPEAMARAIARSLGAVSVSMALLNRSGHDHDTRTPHQIASPAWDRDEASAAGSEARPDEGKPTSLFPSGVRLALLS